MRSVPSGRQQQLFTLPTRHHVLDAPLQGPWPADHQVIYLGMGCYWGAEKLFWPLPHTYSTAVGFMGGTTPFATYDEVCTGLTGHAEVVQVVYQGGEDALREVLTTFWEFHDPTQGDRQGADIGPQYRSAIFFTDDSQRRLVEHSREVFQAEVSKSGGGTITTQIGSTHQVGPFYYALPTHQQYLAKNPGGYDCHSRTGLQCHLAGREAVPSPEQ